MPFIEPSKAIRHKLLRTPRTEGSNFIPISRDSGVPIIIWFLLKVERRFNESIGMTVLRCNAPSQSSDASGSYVCEVLLWESKQNTHSLTNSPTEIYCTYVYLFASVWLRPGVRVCLWQLWHLQNKIALYMFYTYNGPRASMYLDTRTRWVVHRTVNRINAILALSQDKSSRKRSS